MKYFESLLSKKRNMYVDFIPPVFAGVGLYSLYSILQNHLPQKEVKLMQQEIESLCIDQELFSLFLRLQKFKFIDSDLFEKSVDFADNLVFLHKQLQMGEVKPVLDDRPNAFFVYKNCIHNLEMLVKKSRNYKLSRVPVEIHRIYLSILICLERHWTGVLHLTQDISII